VRGLIVTLVHEIDALWGVRARSAMLSENAPSLV